MRVSFIYCTWLKGETNDNLEICGRDIGWKEERVNLHKKEPPRTVDLGESDFGMGHLSLLTTYLTQTQF